MWEIFDKIICIHYLPYKDDRFENIKEELDRVGILNSPNFEWEFTVPNIYMDYIKFPQGRKGDIKSRALRYALQYYTLIKKLCLLNYNKVLVLEDDIVFHKDLNFIKTLLDSMPPDWDVVNFDPFRRKGWLGNGKGCWGHYYDLRGNEVKQDSAVDLFVRYSSIVYNASCVAFTHKALERFVENTEKCLEPADYYSWKDTGDLKTYCTSGFNSMCLQNKDKYEEKITNDPHDGTMEHNYRNFPFENYNFKERKTVCEIMDL